MVTVSRGGAEVGTAIDAMAAVTETLQMLTTTVAQVVTTIAAEVAHAPDPDPLQLMNAITGLTVNLDAMMTKNTAPEALVVEADVAPQALDRNRPPRNPPRTSVIDVRCLCSSLQLA